jgi:hypothetical protein
LDHGIYWATIQRCVGDRKLESVGGEKEKKKRKRRIE